MHLYCELLICTQESKYCVENDLDGNYSPTTADGTGLGGQDIRWQTYECETLDFYQVLIR